MPATENDDQLMAQKEDLDVLRLVVRAEGNEAKDPAQDQVEERARGGW
jgi:hypothetical protein